jgi:hypothetical protein
MNNQLKPVLCETENEDNFESENDIMNLKVFRQNDKLHIPDFSDQRSYTSSDEQNYHAVMTKNDKVKHVSGKSETIDNIIKKLDANEVDNISHDEHNEYVTKSKLSTILGDMRVDILSLVNLLSTLNKNINESNEEMQNLKKDIIKLVSENNNMRDRMNRMKEDNERRYNSMCQTYDKKLDDLVDKIYRLEKVAGVNHTNIHEDSNIKIMKKIETKQQQKDNIQPEINIVDEIKINSFTDSQMEKNASKFKVVPARSRKLNGDTFGVVVQEEEKPVYSNVTRQVMRKENVETTNNSKKLPDTKQMRANRLGIQTNK